jgi:hypothetical protein
MTVIADLQIIRHSLCVDMFIVYLHAKFHVPSSSDSLVKLKVNGCSGMVIILLFCILQIEELALTKVRSLYYKSVAMHHVNTSRPP